MGGLVSSGPLSAFEAGYVPWLVERGYRPGAVADRLGQFRALSRWLGARGPPVAELDPERVEEFLEARRAAGHRSYVAASSVRLPLEYLIAIGVASLLEVSTAPSPVDRLLEKYRRYLLLERRLAERTIAGYECVARVFLEHRLRRCGGLELERLSAADVSEFVAFECQRLTDGAARGQVAKLRPFLVYLHVTEQIDTPLRWAVPKVADMRGRAMPHALEPEAVAKLLASCDRQRAGGCRDYAIVLLLVRLGLRSVEVAAMQLDDIDWRAGDILVRGKGGRHDRLPLPIDVGEALTGYLQRRPPGESRAVFVGMIAAGRAADPTGDQLDRERGVLARRDPAGGGASAASYRGDADAQGGLLAGGDRPGAAPRAAAHHRDLRQGRLRGAADARAAVARRRCGMTVLDDRLAEYLHVRRQLGFKLKLDGYLLADFVAFLETAGAERITNDLSVTWASRPGASARYHMERLSMVRGFARYLATIDPANEIPPIELLHAREQRNAPYLYSRAGDR